MYRLIEKKQPWHKPERGSSTCICSVLYLNPQSSPDELLQDVQPAHPRSVVQGGAAVVPAPVGIRSGLEEDPDALQVPVDHAHVERRLAFDVHQVHLGSLGDQVGHAGGVSSCGCDPQRSAGQAATAPHGLLIDAPGGDRRGGGGGVVSSCRTRSNKLELSHLHSNMYTFSSYFFLEPL